MSNEEEKNVVGFERDQSYDSVGITIAAPETIRSWSRGITIVLPKNFWPCSGL